jgi:hypothetical protein
VFPNDNSRYRYNFPGTQKFENDQIALSNIYIYYSWYNVVAQNNNNTFSYIWTDGTGSTTTNITLPDGAYDVSTINAYLQFIMLSNGNYLVDSNGDYVYYLELVLNTTYYGVEIRAYPLPTSLPSGWTNPAGVVFPATASTPQLIIPATNIRSLLGFDAGTYPSAVQATTYNVLSQNTPQIAVVQSIIVTCSLLNNRLSNPNTVLYSFTTANREFGQLIYFSVPELIFTDIENGFYDRFEIQFLDQNFNPLPIRDTNLVVQMVIRKRDPFEMKGLK